MGYRALKSVVTAQVDEAYARVRRSTYLSLLAVGMATIRRSNILSAKHTDVLLAVADELKGKRLLLSNSLGDY